MPATSNSSATGGYLAPSTPAPAGDLDLDAQIRDLLAGLTGLPGDLVRPRWQAPDDGAGKALPRMPDRATTWVAVGVTSIAALGQPAFVHFGEDEGYSVLHRQERIEALATFYGPRSDAYAALVRDSLYVAQNREGLLARGMALTDVGEARRIPEIVAMGTRRRTDLPLTLVRAIERTYPIRNVVQGVGTISADFSTDGTPVVRDLPFRAPRNP